MKAATQYPYTEQTANGLVTYHEPTFRTYAPEWGTGPKGTKGWITVCETLEGGRWEGFVTYKPATNGTKNV